MTGRLGRHVRAAAALVRPTVRLLPWWHLGIGATFAAVIVWSGQGDSHLTIYGMTRLLRLAMACLALSVAFVLDDPTEDDLAAAGLPVAARRTVRLGLTVPLLAALWAGLLAAAVSAPALKPPPGAAAVDGFVLPVWALSLEFGALVALTLAAAGVAIRRSADRVGGLVAAPATLAMLGAALLLPERWSLFLPPWAAPTDGQPTPGWLAWVASHQRWALLGVAAVTVLMWAGRDAGRRRLGALLRVYRSASQPTEVPTNLAGQPLARV